jgi:predicted RNase H-like HicB family nuclease
MTHYIALIHKERDSCYGVSFPDIPGVITAGATVEEAMRLATEVLEFASEDWIETTGQQWPRARTIDELRADPDYLEHAVDAVVALVPFRARAEIHA